MKNLVFEEISCSNDLLCQIKWNILSIISIFVAMHNFYYIISNTEYFVFLQLILSKFLKQLLFRDLIFLDLNETMFPTTSMFLDFVFSHREIVAFELQYLPKVPGALSKDSGKLQPSQHFNHYAYYAPPSP